MEKGVVDMSLSGIAVDVLSGLVGVLGESLAFRWVRRSSDDAVFIDLHPVLVFLALTAAFVVRTIVRNLLTQ
jgi:hypothetical protein